MSDPAEPSNGQAPAQNGTAWLRLAITPEPSDDEGEALVAAIATYLAVQAAEPPAASSEPPASRWQSAGRRAAIRGRAGAPPIGWGRDRVGWR